MKKIYLKNQFKTKGSAEQMASNTFQYRTNKNCSTINAKQNYIICKRAKLNLKNIIKMLTFSCLAMFLTFTLCTFLSKGVFIASKASAITSAAKSVVVMEATTQKILEQKNKDVKAPIASTTKILTAIVVLENVKDLDEVITVPKEAVGVEGSSIYLKNDEQISIRNLLYGLMLSSGNDTAVALAIHTAGSIEKFAEMMNDKAKEIGATNSNFTCPHGLDDKNNYSTAHDLALIASYGVLKPEFVEICSTKNHKVNATNKYQERYLYNKNKVLRNVEGGIGVKTGYTKKAGRCLVGAAKRNGMTIVTVVINCGPMFEETYKMLDNAFLNYDFYSFLTGTEIAGEATVANGVKNTVKVINKSEYKQLINKGQEVLYSVEYEINKNISAPVKKDDVVGKVRIFKENELVFEADLYAAESVNKIKPEDNPDDRKPLDEIIDNFNF